MVAPPAPGLEGIVGLVDGPVQEKRTIAMGVEEPAALIDHDVAEVFALAPDLCAVVPEVVAIGPAPVIKVRVVVDAAAHVAEGRVETAGVGHGLGGVTE